MTPDSLSRWTAASGRALTVPSCPLGTKVSAALLYFVVAREPWLTPLACAAADIVLVSTIDFFYPLVLDPYLQGRIGCANVLSDLYAMGIHNCDNMLMVLAASLDMDPKHRHIVTQEMLRGFGINIMAS